MSFGSCKSVGADIIRPPVRNSAFCGKLIASPTLLFYLADIVYTTGIFPYSIPMVYYRASFTDCKI